MDQSTVGPHYHVLLFNWDFPDRVYFKTTASKEKIYTSGILSSLWPFGYSSVGNVTFGSAAYVARYHLKKVGTVVSKDHYLDKRTGELLSPEFVVMSRKPGIGADWYKKYKTDVFPNDVRVINGVDTKPAKFYDSLYEADDLCGFRKLKLARMIDASGRKKDNSEARLAVKEEVKKSQVRSLSSSLED